MKNKTKAAVIDKKWYAVFRDGSLATLTDSSEVAVRVFLGDGTPADGLYRVKNLEELAELAKKYKGE